ncbi:MAG: CopG family transcriptional regulator [Archaeoglobaceae archaeon]
MKKRLTVYLPEDTLFKVKLLALQRGASVSQLLESILNEHTKEVQLPPKNKK